MSQAMTDVQGNTALWSWHFFQPWQEWQNKQLHMVSSGMVGGGRPQAPGAGTAVPTDVQRGKGRRALRTARVAAAAGKSSEWGKAKSEKGSAKGKGKNKKKQTCYAYNNEGCTDSACERVHKCWFCSGDHPGSECTN